MRLTAIALAAAVALVGCTGAPTEPEPETASAAQFVACLKAAGVDARVGSQGHALVLVGAAPTGEPGEVVRHESSAEGEAQAILAVQKANADAIRLLNEAMPTDKVLALRSLEALAKVANGKATKIIIPSELQNLGGVVPSIKELLTDPKED